MKTGRISAEAGAAVMAALGSPARVRLVELLSDGERSVGDLASCIGLDVSTVSRHLATLRRVGLLKTRKEGSTVRYSLATPCVLDFFGCVERVLSEGSCASTTGRRDGRR
jgi:DNA-binding transcriptional ArsR family regulator